jgi:ferredoxin
MQHKDESKAFDASVHPEDIPRPPGAALARLEARCSGCGDCAAVCPRSAIGRDAEGFPVLFDAGGCDCCGLCADVCTRGAIVLTDATRAGLVKTMKRETRLAKRLLAQ